MACSRFEYVKQFERDDRLLPGCWIVLRIDGRGFTRFADLHGFAKPNDDRALRLMDAAASDVALALGAAGKKNKGGRGSTRESESGGGGGGGGGPLPSSGVVLGFGTSDEYSLVLGPRCQIYDRREAKLVSVAASTFAASYVRRWDSFFRRRRGGRGKRRGEGESGGGGGESGGGGGENDGGGGDNGGGGGDNEGGGDNGSDENEDTPLRSTPSFDCRAVLYPTARHLRDYLAWRQADAHVNCQHNACFWALVRGDGKSATEAAAALRGTRTADKNELLFQRGLNYSRLPARHRKGSVLLRRGDVLDAETESTEAEAEAEAEGKGEEEKEGNGAGETCGDGAKSSSACPSSSSSLAFLAPGWAVAHCDIIKDDFWDARPHLISEGGH